MQQIASRTVGITCLLVFAVTFTGACDSSTSRAGTPAAVLAAFLAAHRDSVVHTHPIVSGRSHIAIVGRNRGVHDHVIAVLSLDHVSAIPLANLSLPYPSFEFAPDTPLRVADATGDGAPDVLVRLLAADNEPGVVVSNDGAAWRLVPVSSDATDVYIARDPTFKAGRLTSTSNDCIPDCADGRMTTITWRYDRQGRQFVEG